MANTIAYAALFGWPLITGLLFAQMSAQRAVLWSLLAGFLLLPVGVSVDPPGVPPFDKTSIPTLAVLVFALMQGREAPRLVPTNGWARLFLILVLVGPLATALLNGDRLVYGPRVLPDLSAYDGISMVVQASIMVVPFLLARHYFATPESHRILLKALLIAGLAYTLPMIFEMRMSPQLHSWIYGFFQHIWQQMYRFGGYRPIVFLPHGLEVALFAVLVAGAAATLWRMSDIRDPERPRRTLILAYLVVIVVLCRTASAWAYALFLVPVILAAGRQIQMRLAMALVGLSLLYPALRANDLFPTETLVSLASNISEARAGSLGSRFEMEDILLEKARERLFFGWGTSGRNRVYHPTKGFDMSVTDGAWIITFGSTGVVGFVGTFGLLGLPVLLLLRRTREDIPVATAGLSLMLAVNMVDLLPNSSLWPITWLMAGALLGYAESLARAPKPIGSGRRRGARARPAATDPAAGDSPAPGRTGPRRPLRARTSRTQGQAAGTTASPDPVPRGGGPGRR